MLSKTHLLSKEAEPAIEFSLLVYGEFWIFGPVFFSRKANKASCGQGILLPFQNLEPRVSFHGGMEAQIPWTSVLPQTGRYLPKVPCSFPREPDMT